MYKKYEKALNCKTKIEVTETDKKKIEILAPHQDL